MAWDDDNKKGNDSWRPKGDKGPADLDAIVRDLQRRISGWFSGRKGGGSGGNNPLNAGIIGFAFVALIGVWALTGFYTVDEAEQGVVLRFGNHVDTTQPGLRWHLPWPIEAAETVNTGATETWTYQGSMLTRDENIVIVDLIVQYRRTNPVAYLFSLREPETTLRDVTASAIREIIGKNGLDFILTDGRPEVASRTQELLQTTLDTYGTGITVYEVNMQEANFPAEVESAVQDAIKAREDRERAILEAQAYTNDILPRARGNAARQIEEAEAYRARKIANAEGEADRFVQVMGAYQNAPDVTRERLYLETLEQILADSSKVLIDQGEGGGGSNNLLYLPLDQLMRGRSTADSSSDSSSSSSSSSSSDPQSVSMPSGVEISSSRQRTSR